MSEENLYIFIQVYLFNYVDKHVDELHKQLWSIDNKLAQHSLTGFEKKNKEERKKSRKFQEYLFPLPLFFKLYL